uniref:Glucokinase n=1 Tax=Candidatus Kentrum eta TaxID=2126337 RepID=A0A450V5A6_9GAMM|nr:MAG: glucokinase [Candidatus Kentron sp. H]VFJ99950.1 MAG: glucokinase [Candidatus Kentron sp. H]VFK04526.1 MAG: glucokinase [Candidatus Kentron sp. H]
MNIIIGFDIGGTNSRAAIAGVEGDKLIPHPDFPDLIDQKVGSKNALKAFIRDLLGRLPETDRLTGALLALAGPVTHRRGVTMTNWPESRDMTLEEFVEWGLPRERTTLLNDMEAGCYGLVRHLREGGGEYFERVGDHDAPSPVALDENGGAGNRVFIAPGTGLGAAGIIEVDGPPGAPPRVYPIAAELQNTPMPVLRAEHRTVVDWLRREKHIPHPTWEDIVSGRGLVSLYRALAAASTNGSAGAAGVLIRTADPAAAIAKAGIMGEDPMARQALSVFYGCVGHFCQLMALGFQAFGGVFIGGASTLKNRDFIQDDPNGSVLPNAFLNNPTQRPLLARFPLYLVKKGDLNLDGTLWFGHHLS